MPRSASVLPPSIPSCQEHPLFGDTLCPPAPNPAALDTQQRSLSRRCPGGDRSGGRASSALTTWRWTSPALCDQQQLQGHPKSMPELWGLAEGGKAPSRGNSLSSDKPPRVPGPGSRAGRRVASSAALLLAGHRDPQGGCGVQGREQMSHRSPWALRCGTGQNRRGLGTAMSQLHMGKRG